MSNRDETEHKKALFRARLELLRAEMGLTPDEFTVFLAEHLDGLLEAVTFRK